MLKISAVQLFDINEHNVEFGVTEDGTPYAVGPGFAKMLGYRDAANAVRLLDEDEYGTRILSTSDSNGRLTARPTTVIYEDGIWELIFRSNLPGAKAAKKRVKEILREVRKTGSYNPHTAEHSPLVGYRVREKGNYKVLRDIVAGASDYDPQSEASRYRFAELQNYLYRQITGMNAAQLMRYREISMEALESTRRDGKPYAADIKVAKNYLTEIELKKLDAVVLGILSNVQLRLINRPRYVIDDIYTAVQIQLRAARAEIRKALAADTSPRGVFSP